MTCIQPNAKAASAPDWGDVPHLAYRAEHVPSPLLMFSDNPETIVFAPAVLWSYRHEEQHACVFAVRVYMWHVNESGSTTHIGVTIEPGETGGDGDLVIARADAVGHVEVGRDYFKDGKCLAKAALDSTLHPFLPADLVLPAGSPGRPVCLHSRRVAHRGRYFACFEFTIRRRRAGRGPMCFTLRTAVDSEDVTRCTSPPPPAEPVGTDLEGQARGTWPYSKVRIEMEEPYQAGSGGAAMQLAGRVWGTDSCTPDGELFRARDNLYDEAPSGSKANEAMYAADYDPIKVSAYNPSDEPRRVGVSIGTRLGPLSGLVGAFSGPDGVVHGFPQDTQKHLYRDDADPNAPNTVPVTEMAVPPGETVAAALRFQVGGCSSTPWWIVFRDLD